MGPISDFTPEIARDALSKILANEDTLMYRRQLLDEASAYTKSGRAIKNPLTSKAIMSGSVLSLGEGVEGRTVSNVLKSVGPLETENAILRAVQALGTSASKATAPTPSIPSTSIGSKLLKVMNPILLAAQLLTQTSDLNSNEEEELAKLRDKGTK
jgi:hypothetical protein